MHCPPQSSRFNQQYDGWRKVPNSQCENSLVLHCHVFYLEDFIKICYYPISLNRFFNNILTLSLSLNSQKRSVEMFMMSVIYKIAETIEHFNISGFFKSHLIVQLNLIKLFRLKKQRSKFRYKKYLFCKSITSIRNECNDFSKPFRFGIGLLYDLCELWRFSGHDRFKVLPQCSVLTDQGRS